MRAPRRAGRGDVQVAKLDRAQAGAAAQLPVRDLLRGHGESLRVRVRGMPGSPSLPPGPWPPRGPERPRSPALARRRRPQPGARAARGALGRTHRPTGARRGSPRPAPHAHWSGCVCSAASNFSRIPLVSPGRASQHLGAGEKGPKGARARERESARARAVGADGTGTGRAQPAEGSGCPGGARSRDGGAGLARPSARDPAAVGEGGVP